MADLMTNFPAGFANGVSIRGLPLVQTHPGQVYWLYNGTTLDSGHRNGSDGNKGTFNAPFATLDYAIGQCRANKGDVIFIKPGHAETISTATAVAADVAGVAIVGLGYGSNRPTFTFGTVVGATIAVSAANVCFANCLFVANFADVTAPFTLGAAPGFTLNNCEFRDTSAILNFVNIVDTNATTDDAMDLSIIECKRLGLGATAATCLVKMDGANKRLTIKGCYVAHAATTQAGLMPIATGKVVTDAIISDNIINLVGSAGATTGIIITTDGSTNSGVIARNYVQSLDATTEILVTASSGFTFFENRYSGAADTSGYLRPVADA